MTVDYSYYTQIYFGNAIPEKAFHGMLLRAGEALQWLKRTWEVTVPGEESEKMALCAMAEAIYLHEKRRTGVVSAAVGEVNVRYENGAPTYRQLQRELYQRAGVYLQISRGVSG